MEFLDSTLHMKIATRKQRTSFKYKLFPYHPVYFYFFNFSPNFQEVLIDLMSLLLLHYCFEISMSLNNVVFINLLPLIPKMFALGTSLNAFFLKRVPTYEDLSVGHQMVQNGKR